MSDAADPIFGVGPMDVDVEPDASGDRADEDAAHPGSVPEEDPFLGDLASLRSIAVESPAEGAERCAVLVATGHLACLLLFKPACAHCVRF